MGLFRKATPADRFEKARRAHRAPRTDVEGPLGALFDELGLVTQALGDGTWELELGRQQAIVVYDDEYGGLAVNLPHGKDVEGREESLELLSRNLDAQLPWFAIGSAEDYEWPLAGILQIPLEGFDRSTVLLALEHLAGMAEAAGRAEPELLDRLRGTRRPRGGELVEQQAHERSRASVVAALAALEVPAAEEDDRPGVWRLAIDDDIVEAVLRDTGESLMLLRSLPVVDVLGDDALARYLLTLSSWVSARIGLGEAAGEPVLYACTVVPAVALSPGDLAFALQHIAVLAEGYLDEFGP